MKKEKNWVYGKEKNVKERNKKDLKNCKEFKLNEKWDEDKGKIERKEMYEGWGKKGKKI